MTGKAGTRLLGVLAVALLAASIVAVPATGSKGNRVTARPAIIGGTVANPADWPFAVAIRHKGRFLCGGSAIAPTVVLTAAHCAIVKPRGRLTVVAGRPRLRDSSAGETIRVAAARIHPTFKRKKRHDMAVLYLASPTSVTPIELASPEEDFTATVPGLTLRTAGYGARDAFGLRYPSLLKQTNERVRRPRRCRRAYRKLFSRRTMICSLGRRFKRGSLHTTVCAGDSGGPLVADTPAGPRLVGISSYGGFICGAGFTPTVYARVSAGLVFIQHATGVTP